MAEDPSMPLWWGILVVVGVLGACGTGGLDRDQIDMLFALDARSAAPRSDRAAVRTFGAELFAARLGATSCRDCHAGEHGQDGSNHGRNTPALADSARQLLLGWDGAVDSLERMIAAELARRCGVHGDADAERVLAAQPALRAAWEVAFPGEPVAVARVVQALAAHLDGWRTRGRWDRYVEGDDAALTLAERQGLAAFVAVGCAACHASRTLGGRSRHRLGVALSFPTADTGLHAVTGRDADRGFFRAPMLRLAARTGPYLHDGSVADLGEVVRLMGRHELGRTIEDAQVAAIVAFLRAAADAD